MSSPDKKEAALSRPQKRAFIGPALVVEGEIKGQEDLVIEGLVRGKIELPANDVLVNEPGRVEADVLAKNMSVRGEIIGDIKASGRVTIERMGRMKGNISASVISIEDGAQFKGVIKITDKA